MKKGIGISGVAQVIEARMSGNVYHPGIHLFTSYWTGQQVSDAAEKFKEAVLGKRSNSTCYQGPDGKAQLTVQTEFIPSEYATAKDPLSLLDDRIDALLQAGLAVHLLLPVHQIPPAGWLGVDWPALQAAWPGGVFDPYQPSAESKTKGVECPYDILSENFHLPIIQHLVESGRAEKLAVIYVMNEFGYPENEILDNASYWGGSSDWMSKRSIALAATAERTLNNARSAAKGKVPVGLKFAQLSNPNTGWTPASPDDVDQLENILNIMSVNADVLGYDLYYNNSDLYDAVNRQRLEPFLPMFLDGYFEISETGRECTGCPGVFNTGSRTSSKDIQGSAEFWAEAKGYNLFAWNASGQWNGWYAIVNEEGQMLPNTQEELGGLWDLIKTVTGSENPAPCY